MLPADFRIYRPDLGHGGHGVGPQESSHGTEIMTEDPPPEKQAQHKRCTQNQEEKHGGGNRACDQDDPEGDQRQKEKILQPDIADPFGPVLLKTCKPVIQPFKRFLKIPHGGEASSADPFGRRRKWADHAPDSASQGNKNGLEDEPPGDPHKDYGDVAVAHGASPQGAQDEKIEDDKIRENDQKLKISVFDHPFQPRKSIQKVPPLKAFKEGRGTNPEQQEKAESQPDGKGDKEMIGGIGSYNQFTGHERMEPTAGLCTSKGEFSRFVGDKLYFGNFVPVALKGALIVFPGIFQKIDALLLDNKINGIPVQQESMGNIERRGFQNNGISLVDNNPRRGIAVFLGGKGNVMGAGPMGDKSNRNRDRNGQLPG